MRRLAVFLSLLCLLSIPVSAAYIPESSVTENRDGRQLIIKTYQLSPEDDPSELVDEPFDLEGYHYEHLETVKEDQTFHDSKAHTETVTVTTSSDSLAAILEQLAPTMEYSKDGYSGVLTLDHTTLQTEAAGYGIGSSSGSIYPDGTSNDYPLQWGGPSVTPVTAFTPVSDVEQANGSIGTLSIPSLGIRYRVYDGTSSASMRKGVGHFPSTSAWSGNIGLCGHNRGSSHNIGSIKNLEVGDAIRYETSLGTRTYSVSYVGIIDWTDWSYLNATSDNRITLITCLADQPPKRVCVQGIEVSS